MGPTRGAIALGVIAAGVGAFFLVRYLRARAAAAEVESRDDERVIARDTAPIPATAPIGPALA